MSSPSASPGARRCGGPDWTPDSAAAAARRHGIHLTPAHWQILGCAREECLRTRHLPDASVLARRTGVARAEIEALFPGGARRVIAEIAGMRPLRRAPDARRRDGMFHEAPKEP